MKVLLTKDVQGLGRAGDIKEVSDGHARNFLIPRHLGLPATSVVLAKVQKEEKEKQAKITREQERVQLLKNKIDGKTVTIKARAQGANLFAAIHEKDIALALTEKLGTEVSPQLVKLAKPLKSVGEHEVEIRFAETAIAKVKLNIEAL